MRAARVDVAVAGAVALVCGGAWLVSPYAFAWLVTEDGLVEWLQVACFGAAAWWFATAARRTGRRLPAVAAAGFVAVVGEELAWGQRLLDLHVPVVQEANRQGELTLHNLGEGLQVSWAAFAVLAVAGWLGHRLVPALPSVASVVAPPRLAWLFAPGALYAASRLVVADPTYAYAKASECFELCVALGYALTARSRVPASRLRDAGTREPRDQRMRTDRQVTQPSSLANSEMSTSTGS